MDWIYAIRKLANGEEVPDDVAEAAIEQLELMIMNSTTPSIRAMMIAVQDGIRNRDAAAIEAVMNDAHMLREVHEFLEQERISDKYDKVVSSVFQELIELTGNKEAAGAIVSEMVDKDWMLFYADPSASVACFLSLEQGIMVLAIAIGSESQADELARKFSKTYVREWWEDHEDDVIARLVEIDLCPRKDKVNLGVSMLLRRGQ